MTQLPTRRYDVTNIYESGDEPYSYVTANPHDAAVNYASYYCGQDEPPVTLKVVDVESGGCCYFRASIKLVVEPMVYDGGEL